MVLGGCLFQPFPGSFQVFFHAESVQADDSHIVLLGGVAGPGGAKIPVLPFPGLAFREALAFAEWSHVFPNFMAASQIRQGGFSGVFIRRRMFFPTPAGPSLYRWASPQYPLGLPRSAAFWKSCNASGYFLWDMANTALAREAFRFDEFVKFGNSRPFGFKFVPVFPVGGMPEGGDIRNGMIRSAHIGQPGHQKAARLEAPHVHVQNALCWQRFLLESSPAGSWGGRKVPSVRSACACTGIFRRVSYSSLPALVVE